MHVHACMHGNTLAHKRSKWSEPKILINLPVNTNILSKTAKVLFVPKGQGQTLLEWQWGRQAIYTECRHHNGHYNGENVQVNRTLSFQLHASDLTECRRDPVWESNKETWDFILIQEIDCNHVHFVDVSLTGWSGNQVQFFHVDLFIGTKISCYYDCKWGSYCNKLTRSHRTKFPLSLAIDAQIIFTCHWLGCLQHMWRC